MAIHFSIVPTRLNHDCVWMLQATIIKAEPLADWELELGCDPRPRVVYCHQAFDRFFGELMLPEELNKILAGCCEYLVFYHDYADSVCVDAHGFGNASVLVENISFTADVLAARGGVCSGRIQTLLENGDYGLSAAIGEEHKALTAAGVLA